MTLEDARVGVVGLGYVGLPLAVEFGRSREVVGFDTNRERVAQLESGYDVTREVAGASLAGARFLSFSADAADLEQCSILIVTVPTPIDGANRPDLRPLLKATETVASVLKAGDIVIYESTVYPGCTEEQCVPVLEAISGLQYNKDFFCGYSPERVNPGDKINTLTRIKKITSGSTPEVAKIIDNLYSSIILAGTYPASAIRVAEAAKVIENAQRDLNIAFVNELSVIFERLGIDTIEVLEAAGSKWNFLPYRPGMVGGHCIGVDPYYLTHKAEEMGYHPQVILAGRRINDNMARYVARKVVQMMLSHKQPILGNRVGILGVTFKENCPDIRNSKVVDLIAELHRWNVETVVVDPWCDSDELYRETGLRLGSISAAEPVDALVVAVGHNEYRSMSPSQLREICPGDGAVLADVKSLYNRHLLAEAGFNVFRL
ncbi:nucleotide sugar dehydrogenase [Porphyrobacter algicida]|uniref:Nucleotide sugar dehydrogenase n=1 Tax=Qipengyuania algicida TaxID=1836209 RepID=A0A845AEY5_9SPHN|nr:nucleotide sugar dehydrogenase [Qipengyuania algicida]